MIGTGAMSDPYLHLEKKMTLTTYDETLCSRIEPNVCTTAKRIEVLNRMKEEGIPTVVWMTPILPFINDTEENIRSLLNACQKAGVYGIVTFGVGLTLRDGDRQYYYQNLDKYFPGLKQKYIQTYGNAYELPVLHEKELMSLIRRECEKAGMEWQSAKLFDYLHQFEDKGAGEQISLFDLNF